MNSHWITNVIIYWILLDIDGTSTSSSRFYKEWYMYENQIDLRVDQLVIPSSVPVRAETFCITRDNFTLRRITDNVYPDFSPFYEIETSYETHSFTWIKPSPLVHILIRTDCLGSSWCHSFSACSHSNVGGLGSSGGSKCS